MSRSLTADAVRSLMAQETDQVWLVLLTIDHPDMAQPIRIVHNNVDIVSNGNTYLAFPFRFTMPGEAEEAPPRVQIEIDNVDRQIMQGIQSLSSAPTITMEIVTDADLDVIEIGPTEMVLRDVMYNSLVIQGDLGFEPILDDAYPSGRFNPPDFPGLF